MLRLPQSCWSSTRDCFWAQQVYIGASGKMADNAADLIQRAAARLKKNQTEGFAPVPVLARQSVHPGAKAPVDMDAMPPARSDSTSSEARRPHADLSPAILAVHGMVHPSSGFSRTREEFRSLKR